MYFEDAYTEGISTKVEISSLENKSVKLKGVKITAPTVWSVREGT